MNGDAFFRTDQITPADNEIEIIDLIAEPYQDHRRVKINFRLSFFQEPPNAAITLYGVDGEKIASVDLVNLIEPENEITLHIPKSQSKVGEYQVQLNLFKLGERKARAGEEGEVKLTTQSLTSRSVSFVIK